MDNNDDFLHHNHAYQLQSTESSRSEYSDQDTQQLIRIIRNRELIPHFQPIIDLFSGDILVVTHENFENTPHPGKLSEIAASLKKKIKLRNTEKYKSDYLIERRTYCR
jgi:hypothetical protein